MAIFQSAPIDEVQSRDACSETKCSPQNIGCLPAPHSLVALAKLCLICPFSQPSTPSSSSTKLLTAQRSSFKLNKAPHSSTPLLQVQQSSAQLDTLSSSSTGLCIAQHTLSKLNKAPQSSTPLLQARQSSSKLNTSFSSSTKLLKAQHPFSSSTKLCAQHSLFKPTVRMIHGQSQHWPSFSGIV